MFGGQAWSEAPWSAIPADRAASDGSVFGFGPWSSAPFSGSTAETPPGVAGIELLAVETGSVFFGFGPWSEAPWSSAPPGEPLLVEPPVEPPTPPTPPTGVSGGGGRRARHHTIFRAYDEEETAPQVAKVKAKTARLPKIEAPPAKPPIDWQARWDDEAIILLLTA